MSTDALTVLVVGSGGREHTLAWSVARSPRVAQVLVAPGNAGTGIDHVNVAVPADDLDGIVAAAVAHEVDLVIVGPEVPLVAGLADQLVAAGIRTFGPSEAASRLEGSKAWANDFMARHNIPTSASAAFTDVDSALNHLATLDAIPVVKASGLAAGKGVVMPESMAEAAAAIRSMLVDGIFGASGAEVVLEEWLTGPELSVLAVCSGTEHVVLTPARDHKRIGDGDTGPNTGGMGAYCPAGLPDGLIEEISATIIEPTLRAMAAEGCPYTGVLYAGLMLTAQGPKVIEFNCRLGDPETQVVLPLLESDLVDLIDAALDNTLPSTKLRWRDGAAATVVVASPGYPATSTSGLPIAGLDNAAATGALVFHAGTAVQGDDIVTAGGRVLAVTGLGDDLDAAVAAAYEGAAKIRFDGMQLRTDIGRPIPHQEPSGNPTSSNPTSSNPTSSNPTSSDTETHE